MLSFSLLVLLTTLSILVLCLSIHQRISKHTKTEQRKQPVRVDPNTETEQPVQQDSSAQLLEERLVQRESEDGEPDSSGSGLGSGRVDPDGQGGTKKEKKKKKKKKKRSAEKKGSNPKGEEEREANGNRDCNGVEESFSKVCEESGVLVRLYPFTSSSSGTQRKIKIQYDEIMKRHRSKEVTFAQVAQFAHCLVEAKNELQHKADVIQRKFTIKKALLLKADRSSTDRLRQQIYKLELEQKRLEEDAFVYNWLQQQLKLSPAYKKMLEVGARMESEAKSRELMESRVTESEYSDISFEELLAQEKKDSFWQRNGKLRPCSS